MRNLIIYAIHKTETFLTPKQDAIDQETADATAKKLVPAERPFLEQKLEAMWGYNTAVIVVHVLMTTLLMVTYTLAGYIMWWSLASRMMHKKAGRSKDACVSE